MLLTRNIVAQGCQGMNGELQQTHIDTVSSKSLQERWRDLNSNGVPHTTKLEVLRQIVNSSQEVHTTGVLIEIYISANLHMCLGLCE